jgi:predicted MFS family arabinose efflux permease
MSSPGSAERRLVALIGAVQFVNILDFMMVMPLGPDFARALGIAESQVGWVGGAYLASASVAGVLLTPVLDRHDRRTALIVSLAGLFVGTLAGAFATDLPTLVAARVFAGVFGGPASAVALAMLTDAVPAERRGRAMGAVMGAFSASSVLGVPAGLEIARIGGWRAPFVVVAALGAVIAIAARLLLPSMTAHLARAGLRPDGLRGRLAELFALARLPGALASAATVAALHGSAFAIVPNIAAFYQGNLGYPRERFGLLYLAGGAASFFTMRLAGGLTDRHGAARVAAGATVLIAFVLVGNLGLEWRAVPPMAWFVSMMVGMSTRNVAWQTLASRVPPPSGRAGLLSLLSSVQHAAAATGAFVSSALLSARPGGGLDGMPRIVAFALACGLAVLPVMSFIEQGVRRREAAGSGAAA